MSSIMTTIRAHRVSLATTFACLLALLLAFVAPSAAAQEEYCVSTVAQFNTAWSKAQIEPVVIKMTTGIWNMSGSGIDSDNGNLLTDLEPVRIQGGYLPGCAARSEDPAATVLTGAALDIDVGFDGSDIAIERLTFRNVPHLRIWSGNGSMTLERLWFDLVGTSLLTGDRVVVRNSLVTLSGGTQGAFGNCAIEVNTYNLESMRVEHTTFASNVGDGALCLARDDLPETDNWLLRLYSNVFWDNTQDVRLRKRNSVPNIEVHAFNNIFGNGISANRPVFPVAVATLTSDPQFVNAAANDWRPAGGSPAINSGRVDINLNTQKDFAGNPRWFGAAPDRGAFESNVGSTATVLSVTNSNDSGAGSLRQALIDANATPNLNRIHFNIPGGCPRVITLASLLPTIAHPVIIDGYTQPGASRNSAVAGNNATLCVVIDGANQLTGAYGLNVATNASPDATVSIEGLGFSGHSIAAVQFAGGRDHRLAGVQVGGAFGSFTALPSGTGVRIGGATEGVHIGGPEPGDRNVIVHATGTGISLSGSGSTQPSGAIVQNNYVGTRSGGDQRGNDRGILITSPGHLIRDNVIASNSSHGIDISGSHALGNRIINNRIGVPALCLGTCTNRGNGGHGIRIANNADGTVVDGNHIAFSGSDGVAVIQSNSNTLRRNRFHDNTGIGIDLGDDGIDFASGNNANPPANSANGNQNNPFITSAEGSGAAAQANGSLTSANGWYRIDFYAVPQCSPVVIGNIPIGTWGQGQEWLGSTIVQITNGTDGVANGSVSYSSANLTAPVGSSGYFNTPRWVTSTATRLLGTPSLFLHRGTSEFGRCRLSTVGGGIFSDGFEEP